MQNLISLNELQLSRLRQASVTEDEISSIDVLIDYHRQKNDFEKLNPNPPTSATQIRNNLDVIIKKSKNLQKALNPMMSNEGNYPIIKYETCAHIQGQDCLVMQECLAWLDRLELACDNAKKNLKQNRKINYHFCSSIESKLGRYLKRNDKDREIVAVFYEAIGKKLNGDDGDKTLQHWIKAVNDGKATRGFLTPKERASLLFGL